MTQQHPITPSPELVVQWIKEFSQPNDPRWQEYEQDIATRAAQWGADQELEACVKWLNSYMPGNEGDRLLRTARRPKPPSLKEQALSALENLNGECLLEGFECPEKVATIRRALEQLDD